MQQQPTNVVGSQMAYRDQLSKFSLDANASISHFVVFLLVGVERQPQFEETTRSDNLASKLLGGVLATLLAVSLKCIVNTP